MAKVQKTQAFFENMQPAAAHAHGCGLSGVFSDAPVAGKNDLIAASPISKGKNNGRNHVNSWFLPFQYEAEFFKSLFCNRLFCCR